MSNIKYFKDFVQGNFKLISKFNNFFWMFESLLWLSTVFDFIYLQNNDKIIFKFG